MSGFVERIEEGIAIQNPKSKIQNPEGDLLWRQIKSVPAFRALLRSVEARFYQQLPIAEPVLDLGCGDGHFAQMTFDRPLAAGVDPWWGPLAKAQRAEVYHLATQARGDHLPFADGAFATVISNSVLEHIGDVQPVLQEANRVLRPGGQVVMTVPSHYFTEFLGGATLLEKLGVKGLAGRYRRLFNAISRHEHTDPPEQWAGRLAQAGFAIEQWQYYFSPAALRALEWGHLQGLPSAVLHALTGHWILAPWEDNLRWTERWVRPFYEEEPQPMGAYLLFVARKQAAGPITVHLPAMVVRDWRLGAEDGGQGSEGAEEQESEGVEKQGEQEAAAVEVGREVGLERETGVSVAGEERPGTVATVTAEQPSTPIAEASPTITDVRGRPTAAGRLLSPKVRGFLVLAGLLAALLGQSYLTNHPADPWPGVRWYVVGLLLIFSLTLPFGRARPIRLPTLTLPRLSAVPKRRRLYPIALLIAFLAQKLSGSAPPTVTLLVWLAAIGAAVYALSDMGDWRWAMGHWRRQITNYQLPITILRRPDTLIAISLFLTALPLRLVGLTEHPFILNGTEANVGLDAWAVVNGQITNPFAAGWLSNPTLPLFLLALPLKLFGPTALGLRFLSPFAGALTVVATFWVGRRLWGREVGLVAALFLLGSHFHIHYSRLGMTNIWDPLLALLALGALALAWSREERWRWLLVGALVGLNATFYTTSHLLPLMLFLLFLLHLLWQPEHFRQQGRHVWTAVGLALVVALPQLLFYQQNPAVFMERANNLGIIQSGWLAQEVARTGQSNLAILGQQFQQAALAFNSGLDTSPMYKPDAPLLQFWPAAFFVLGFFLSLLHLRQMRHSILVMWVLVTTIWAGALLQNPVSSHRLLIATPALALLAAIGLTWLDQKLADSLVRPPHSADQPDSNRPRRWPWPLLLPLLIVTLSTAADLTFYFGRYQSEHHFGDRNTEAADQVGGYLQSLDGKWTAYFYGAPAMYTSFPTIRFLAPEFQPGVNLFDVEQPNAPMLPAATPNRVFIFLPERANELAAVQNAWPGGSQATFSGYHADPLFLAYTVGR